MGGQERLPKEARSYIALRQDCHPCVQETWALTHFNNLNSV